MGDGTGPQVAASLMNNYDWRQVKTSQLNLNANNISLKRISHKKYQ